MKRKLLGISVAFAGLVGLASAGTIATPYIAGDFQGWDPGATPMSETFLGSDIWTYTVTGLTNGQYQQFKITDGTWGTAVPAANSWYTANASGEVTITYDGNTYADGWSADGDRIGLDTDPGAWTVAGDFNGWNNADAATAMTPLGGGIYELTIYDWADGTYYGKPVVTGKWDGIGTEGRSIDAWNFEIVTAGDQNDVVFRVNAFTGAAQVEVIPEPATIGLVGIAGVGLLLARRRWRI